MSDEVEVRVRLTYKQKHWLEMLGEDLRGDFSDGFQCMLNQHIEAQEKGSPNPSSYRVRKGFEYWMNTHEWTTAMDMFEELLARFELAHAEQRVRDLSKKLRELKERLQKGR